MTGWGVKKPNSPNQPNTLKIINILVVDRNKCKNLFATNPPLNTITDNMIWSGDLNGKDFCSVIINFKIFDKINENLLLSHLSLLEKIHLVFN
jgi:hypothetical protein